MSVTFIDTNKLPKQKTPHGDVTEVLNQQLVGAKNIVAAMRWLKAGDTFDAKPAGKHQLVYLVDGKGSIRLNGKNYDVGKGAGVYLAPDEGATIAPAAGASLKLFHLVVPPIPA
ncbi:MAG: AraC family ligand binding domain-containing protein [Xanthobacteraceae bacterium]